jgi:hypothetical protein
MSRLAVPTTGPRRDYRAVLRNDSTVILLDAVVHDDKSSRAIRPGYSAPVPGPGPGLGPLLSRRAPAR